jgi:hypothetical protein
MVKPGLFTNEDLADIPPLGRLLFIGLWGIADREGRLEDRPKRIKAELLPYDAANVEALLTELDQRDFIRRYTVAGARYIQVTNFKRHQTPHIKEPASHLPAPTDVSVHTDELTDKHHTSTVQAPDEHHTSTPLTESLTDTDTESETRRRGADAPVAAAAAPQPEPPAPVEAIQQPRTVAVPKPNRYGQVLDALKERGINYPGGRRDAGEVAKCSAAPALIADAYATFEEWAGDFGMSNKSLWYVCQRIAAYQAWQDGKRARASPNGKAPVSTANEFAAYALRLREKGQ